MSEPAEKKMTIRYRSTGQPYFLEDRLTEEDKERIRREEEDRKARAQKTINESAWKKIEDRMDKRDEEARKVPTLMDAAWGFEKKYPELWGNLGTRESVVREIERLQIVEESAQREGRHFDWRDELKSIGDRISQEAGFKTPEEIDRNESIRLLREGGE